MCRSKVEHWLLSSMDMCPGVHPADRAFGQGRPDHTAAPLTSELELSLFRFEGTAIGRPPRMSAPPTSPYFDLRLAEHRRASSAS
jgi:hypothetical protein